jgi:Family of unknown function (DUF5946)
MIDAKATKCPGCGALFPGIEGPSHAYMTSSPACWAAYGALLADEYSSQSLMHIHRLSVDTYAVQHPGDPKDRRAVQSVGLHLARLMRQLESAQPPKETNDVMVGFAARKDTLIYLEPPAVFSMTMQDVAPFVGGPRHAKKVSDWARSAWNDWSAHHVWIKRWAEGR